MTFREWLKSPPRRFIPLWAHVPWFIISLALVVARGDASVWRWRLAWPWSPGEDLVFRLALEALVIWSAASSWLRNPYVRWPTRWL